MNDAERDAWLREALRHAPDADALPPTGVSDAILSKARAQARGGAPTRSRPARLGAANSLAAFWAWLARPPVAAGFASVMAATLVGLMWWDRPMDEAMPRAPALTAARNDAAPPLASVAPATPAAPPAPAIEAAKSTPPIEGKASAKAAPADDSEAQRRQGSALRPSAAADAKLAEPAATAEKRQLDQLAKERAPVAAAKNETPAPFPAAPAKREAQAAGSLDGAATDVAKKADESRRSRITDAVEPATSPAAQSIGPAPSARPAQPDALTAPAAPPPARAPMTTLPAQAAPAPFGELAQRQRALADSRAKDAAGVAAPAPSEAAAPANAARRQEAERAPVDKAQMSESTPPTGAATNAVTAAGPKAAPRADSPSPRGSVIAATPLAQLLATIGADPARWSRQTAAGQTVALDAAWRAWLSELDVASAGRWRPLDDAAASFAQANAGRDGASAADNVTTLRLFSDGRLAAVVRVDAGIVQLEAAPGTRSERWQATLGADDAARLRTTSRRLPP